MAYCTLFDLRSVLPKTITIGTQTALSPAIVQSQGKPDTLSPQSAYAQIEFATQYINGRLRTVYFCPLQRVKAFETPLTKDVLAGSNLLYVEDAGMFNPGGMVRIGDGTNTETLYLNGDTGQLEGDPTRIDQMRVETNLQKNYGATTPTLVSLLRFPDPIPWICARLAAANIIDKLFVTEKAPDVPTGWGKSQRNQAGLELDAILAGATRLEGQEFNGRRFVPTQLFDTQKATAEFQSGQNKE